MLATLSPTVDEGSSFTTDLAAFAVVCLLDDGLSEKGTPVVLICLSLVAKDVEFKNKNYWLFVDGFFFEN